MKTKIGGNLFWELWAFEVDTFNEDCVDDKPRCAFVEAMRNSEQTPKGKVVTLDLNNDAMAYVLANCGAVDNCVSIWSDQLADADTPREKASLRRSINSARQLEATVELWSGALRESG